jgi:hypothetical protein
MRLPLEATPCELRRFVYYPQPHHSAGRQTPDLTIECKCHKSMFRTLMAGHIAESDDVVALLTE